MTQLSQRKLTSPTIDELLSLPCISEAQNLANIKRCKSAAELKSYIIVRGFVQAMVDLAHEVTYQQLCYWRWNSEIAAEKLHRVGVPTKAKMKP